jgi:CheY-like chemotaxis protein
VSAPTEGGFGTKLIEASIKGQLGGSTQFDWRPSGLQCTLTMPRGDGLGEIAYDGELMSAGFEQELQPAAKNRVLLVEDEALIGMMMVDILTELGYSVVGPITNVAEATALAERGDFANAVLDINLKGQLVYPVADVLIGSGVPFLFVTGYGAERVDKRYANIPILQKPLQKKDLQTAFARVQA